MSSLYIVTLLIELICRVCHVKVMGPDAMILVFWMLSFKPTFSQVIYIFWFINPLSDVSFANIFPHWINCPHFVYGLFFCSVQFSHSVMSNSLWPHGLQHARPPWPSPTPGVYSNSCPLSRWCHPAISSSVVPFSSRLQSFPVSGSFQISQFFTSGGQRIGVSASTSVLSMNIQDWFPLGWTD